MSSSLLRDSDFCSLVCVSELFGAAYVLLGDNPGQNIRAERLARGHNRTGTQWKVFLARHSAQHNAEIGIIHCKLYSVGF